MTNPIETPETEANNRKTAPSAGSDVNMRPITVLHGIVMGTVGAVAAGLSVVVMLYLMLKADYPRLQAELPELTKATAMFVTLSVFAVLSFYGSLKTKPWRGIAMACLWVTLYLVGAYFWPE